MNYLIIIIIIFIIFNLFNYFLNIENFDSTDGIIDLDTYPVNINYEDLCSKTYTPFASIKRQLERKKNRKKKIVKKIITNTKGEIIGEEQVILSNCAGYNEKCLIDENGQNTCCNNLKCVRLSKDYGYKVCSHQKDACGYNKISFTLLKKLFTFNILQKLLDDEWWYVFLETRKKKYIHHTKETAEEEYLSSPIDDYNNEQLNKLRNKIKAKTNDLCKGKKLDGDLFESYIRNEIINILIENEVFAGIIFGVSKSAKSSSVNNNTQKLLKSNQYNNNTRNCRISRKNKF